MKIYFKPKITIVCLLLVALFFRLSYWQWTRHLEKKEFLAELETRLRTIPVPLLEILNSPSIDWSSLINRRVVLEGDYDFSHEMVLRNRQKDGEAGAHVITPFRIKNSDLSVLVDRGFVPLRYSTLSEREKLNRTPHASITGLIKETSQRKFMAPADPEPGKDAAWVDAWLRVDITNIQRQIPYKLIPVYLEIVPSEMKEIQEASLLQNHSERDEMFMPSEKLFKMVRGISTKPPSDFPEPAFDLVLPPSRHLGYVFEWGFMGIFTALICLILQLRPSWSWRR